MIEKIRNYYLVSLTILTIVMSMIGGAWSYLISGYFFIVGLLLYALFHYSYKRPASKRLLLYMAGRMMKLMFSILFLILYALLVNENVKEFLITFGVYYLIYMIFDTVFFYMIVRKVSK